MKTTVKDEFLISCQPTKLSFLKYQIIYNIKGGKMYFKSLNIIHNNKTLKKIYLDIPVLLSEGLDVQQLIINILMDQMYKNSDEKRHRSESTSKNINQKARTEAALNLFSQLNK